MFSKGSILVVDDEVNLCRILGAKLAKNGFSVVAVHDGQQAVDKVRESDFDVVLLDLMLPKLDGLSALAEIRVLDNDLPVIVMTACESPDALEKARIHGVAGYINKPFDLDTLVNLVNVTSTGSSKHHDREQNSESVLFMPNRPITLEIMNGKTSGVFDSAIESRNEDTLCVTAPVRDGHILDVSARTPVRVGLAARDAYYSFNSYVAAPRLSEALLVVDKPNVIYRNQRRQSPRLSIDTSIRYGKIEDMHKMPEAVAIARTCDVGNNGLRMIAKEPLKPGDLVYIETEGVDLLGAFNAVGEVLRSSTSKDSSSHLVAMKFRELKGSPIKG